MGHRNNDTTLAKENTMLDKLTEMTTQDLKRIRDFINVELQYRTPEQTKDINANYVTNKEKDKLIKEILTNYAQENPHEDSIKFQDVLSILKDSYGIQTRTIGNFFHRQLKEYETFGGNKKKFIKLPLDN